MRSRVGRAALNVLMILGLAVGSTVTFNAIQEPAAWAGHCDFRAYVDKHDRYNRYWGVGYANCNSLDKLRVTVRLYKHGPPWSDRSVLKDTASRLCDRTGSYCRAQTGVFRSKSGVQWCAQVTGRSAWDNWWILHKYTSCTS